MYLIGPFDVSKLGSEIVNLLVKGSNIVTTDGGLEGIGGGSVVENKYNRNKLDNELANYINFVLTNYSNLNGL